MIDWGIQLQTIREQSAWVNYEKARVLYHFTPLEEHDGKVTLDVVQSIMQAGLKAGNCVETEQGKRSAIWVFVDKCMASVIAPSMLFPDFALFSIRKKAIPRELIYWDKVAENWATHAFYCLLDHIPPEYIHFSGVYTYNDS